jgi:precorrin-6x reductase
MNKNTELICLSANNKKVVFDTVGSHTATHFDDTPGLRELVMRILKQKILTDPEITLDVDMG